MDGANNKKQLNYKERIISSLRFGDCIFAKRYDNAIQKNKFGDGHNTGPFIVLGVKDDIIYGIYCTSVSVSPDFLEVAKNYRLFSDKKTYVNTTRFNNIKYNQFLNKIHEELNESDKNRLRKKIYHQKYKYLRDAIPIKYFIDDIKCEYDVNDIVSYNNQLYMIISINQAGYTLVPVIIQNGKINISNSNNKIIASPDEFYYLDTFKSNEIDKTNTSVNSETNRIQNYKKKFYNPHKKNYYKGRLS